MTELQEKILEIYKEIKKICDKNNLRYYAIGGTLIGAVRHQGFIPWDDDLDIAMPYPDYLKFYEIIKKELPENLEFFTWKERKCSFVLYMKIHDKTTTFIEESEFDYSDSFKGVFVDIMPLGGVPEDEKEQQSYRKKMHRYVMFNTFRRIYPYKRQHAKNFITELSARLLNVFGSCDFWSKRWERLISQYDYDSAKYTGYTWSVAINPKTIFSTEWFKNYVDLKFEDTIIRCPAEYDKCLTKQFGNYMKVPKKEEQQVHSAIVDINKSYRDYKGYSYSELVEMMK